MRHTVYTMMVSLSPETNYPLIDRPQCQIFVGGVHSYPLSSEENSQIRGEFWSLMSSIEKYTSKSTYVKSLSKNKK